MKKKIISTSIQLETRIAHRCLNRKIRSHLDLSDTNQTYLGANDSHHNPKIYSVIEKRTKNWFKFSNLLLKFNKVIQNKPG